MVLLDFALLLLTSTCIGYAIILNKRIKELSNSRVEFARMIKELNLSITKTEDNIKVMQQLSVKTYAELNESTEGAKIAITDLGNMLDSAKLMIEQLNNKVSGDFLSMDMKNVFDPEGNYERIRAKKGEKFSEDDLLVLDDEVSDMAGQQYAEQLKEFINNVSTKEKEREEEVAIGSNMDQKSYYDTLRKISTNKIR